MADTTFGSPTRRWVARKDAIIYANVGPTKFHELVNRKLFDARMLDGKTIVDLNSIDSYYESLPRAGSNRKVRAA